MATLLYRHLASSGRENTGDFDALKESCRVEIPETVRMMNEVTKALRLKKEDDAYERLLEITSVFKAETGKSCIVILDEFHNLANFRIKRSFSTFGKYIMVQKNTMYIVSSSQRTLLKDILTHKLSLLFGNFEIIDVNGFDNQTARSFISSKIKDAGSDRTISDYFIQVSQGSPFYLEAFAERFSRIMQDKGNCQDAKECLLETFADLLYQSEGVLNQYFTNNINFFLEKKARRKFIPLLVSLARGKSTVKAIQRDMARSDRDLGKNLQKLQDMDLAYNSGVFYKITDKLFEYWLKYVYCLKTRSMIDDMGIKYLEFKHAVEKDYESFCEFSSGDIVDIIQDLFRSFGNEKVQISTSCRVMPRFGAVDRTDLSKNTAEITGRVQDKKWVCHVKQGDITDEQDVYNLLGMKEKSHRTKITRKIFIPLKGIEQNAFLLAKDNGIWVWDVRQLNKTLRLFGKFELVS